MAIYCKKHRTRGFCLDCAKEKREESAVALSGGVMHKKLVDGRIPAFTECFWKDKCRTA